MGQVANVKTPLTYGQALGALLAAGAPAAGLTMIAAQSAVETAGWASMRNWNMGNITPLASQLAAGIDWMDQGLKGMKYISYPDAVSGAVGMMGWINAHGLSAAAASGNLDAFMTGLQNGCYLGCIGLTDPTGHTVSATDYSNYRAGIATWMAKLQNVTPTTPPAGSVATSQGNAVIAGTAIAVTGGLVAFAIHQGISFRDIRRLLPI